MDDYISRSEAIALAMAYCPDDDGVCSKAGQDLRELLDDLENAPPASVRPVEEGEWIWLGDCSNEGLYCSACHAKIHTVQKPKKKLSNFCPNCGVKMKGVQNG